MNQQGEVSAKPKVSLLTFTNFAGLHSRAIQPYLNCVELSCQKTVSLSFITQTTCIRIPA